MWFAILYAEYNARVVYCAYCIEPKLCVLLCSQASSIDRVLIVLSLPYECIYRTWFGCHIVWSLERCYNLWWYLSNEILHLASVSADESVIYVPFQEVAVQFAYPLSPLFPRER